MQTRIDHVQTALQMQTVTTTKHPHKMTHVLCTLLNPLVSELVLASPLMLSTFLMPLSGLGARRGKNTARRPSVQMMGRMMRLATNSSAQHMYRPLHHGTPVAASYDNGW